MNGREGWKNTAACGTALLRFLCQWVREADNDDEKKIFCSCGIGVFCRAFVENPQVPRWHQKHVVRPGQKIFDIRALILQRFVKKRSTVPYHTPFLLKVPYHIVPALSQGALILQSSAVYSVAVCRTSTTRRYYVDSIPCYPYPPPSLVLISIMIGPVAAAWLDTACLWFVWSVLELLARGGAYLHICVMSFYMDFLSCIIIRGWLLESSWWWRSDPDL